MKYCTKCKKGIFNDGVYCPYCGGTLIDYDSVKDGSHVKTCKKCNKDFPPQYKKCAFCGGNLVDKNTFWDKQELVDFIEIDKKQRLVIEKTCKGEYHFVSIGKQYLDKSTGNYVYKSSIPVSIACIDRLISALKK